MQTYASAMEGIQEMRKRVKWDTLAGLTAMQLFRGHVAHSLSSRFRGTILFVTVMHVTEVKLSE